jgi:hypothetical protein
MTCPDERRGVSWFHFFSWISGARNQRERCSSGFREVVTSVDVAQSGKLIDGRIASGTFLKSVNIVRLLQSPNSASHPELETIPEEA